MDDATLLRCVEMGVEGIVLNRVAGTRQEKLIRSAVEMYCGIPVLGAIPKLSAPFPERHMGLVPHHEREQAGKAIGWAGKIVENYIDLESLRRIAEASQPLALMQSADPSRTGGGHEHPRIGYIMDRSFWFYYPENLSHLRELGAELVEIDSMADRGLPELDALYIGGGFPETQAEALARNESFRESVRTRIDEGLPVYAECGGLMYMGEGLLIGDKDYPMVGALPLKFVLEKRPQGHGYTVLEVTSPNPYFPVGEVLKGHEFHYSRPIEQPEADLSTVFRVLRGKGIDGEHDGFARDNLIATYTHLHAGGNRKWGDGLFRTAVNHRKAALLRYNEGSHLDRQSASNR
jgi:cobyrinic acid a,c-diamide synthase